MMLLCLFHDKSYVKHKDLQSLGLNKTRHLGNFQNGAVYLFVEGHPSHNNEVAKAAQSIVK